MLIKCDIYKIRATCKEILKYIEVEQAKQLEDEIKRKLSGWFALSSREAAEKSIKEDRWFVKKLWRLQADTRDMLDAIEFAGSCSHVDLTADEAATLLYWRKKLNLDKSLFEEK